ncbi:MAG: hypothetical protein WAW92_01610 [Minisyncoccia bacterium]
MSVTTLINKVNYYIFNPLIMLMFSLATVYFIYGVIKFLSVDAGDKGNARAEARNAIMYGIIGMVIMLSVYALVAFVLSAFGITVPDTVKPYIRFY